MQTLRHIYHHGSHEFPNLHRYIDVPKDAKLQVSTDYGATFEAAPEKLQASAASLKIERLAKRKHADINDLLDYAYIHGSPADLPSTAWTQDDIAGPNITDKKTIITFAKMASNAYYMNPEDPEWRDVKGGFNYTDDFGWRQDGLRGHIFADEKNTTVVIGLKGMLRWVEVLQW
jgi:lipase ATG15